MFCQSNVSGHSSYKNLRYSDCDNLQKVYINLIYWECKSDIWSEMLFSSLSSTSFQCPCIIRSCFTDFGGIQHANISLVLHAGQKALNNNACWIKYQKTKWLVFQGWRTGIEPKHPSPKQPTLLVIWEYSKFLYWSQICWEKKPTVKDVSFRKT